MYLQLSDFIDDHLSMIEPIPRTKKTGIQAVIC